TKFYLKAVALKQQHQSSSTKNDVGKNNDTRLTKSNRTPRTTIPKHNNTKVATIGKKRCKQRSIL
ncbi:12795_t:CDS:1, partial [Gigaspora margarita]